MVERRALPIPVLVSFRGYQAKWLAPDVLAGLTLVAIAVPEQMATAKLAGMPAVAGLYAFVAGSLVFAILGCSRQMSVGADSTIAPIVATGVAAVAATGSVEYTHLVSFLALMVGVALVAVGLFRMGWISQLLSTPVITGVLAGIAVEIVVRQLPAVLGLVGGGTTTIGKVRAVLSQLSGTNGWSVLIAVVVFALIVVCEQIDKRLPGALAGLVLSILAVAAFHLTQHGVQVAGSIHGGLPSFAIPRASWSAVEQMVGPALTIAFVCVAQTAATLRATATTAPTASDFNQDLLAIGAGSLVAGFAGSFPVNSSPPRTGIVTAAGGKSQLTSVVAGAVVLLIVLLASGLLKDLPKATLGAILLFVSTRLFRVAVLRGILSFSRIEFGLAVLTGLTVAVFGIEQGAILALVVSLADRTRRAARPLNTILGREPGTDHWIPEDVGRETEDVDGVVVCIVYGPLWYGNAEFVTLRMRRAVDAAKAPVRALVIDADGMPDLDYTGAQALAALITDLKAKKIVTAVARSSHPLHHDLKHSGLLSELGPEHLFVSVEDAVRAFTVSG